MRWERRRRKQVFLVRSAEDHGSPAPGQGRRGVLGRPGGSQWGWGRTLRATRSPLLSGKGAPPVLVSFKNRTAPPKRAPPRGKHQMSRQHPVKNRNTNATQKHSFYKVHGAPGPPSSGSSPGPGVAAGPPVPLLAAVGPGLRLEGRNRAQGCPGSRPSCGPERGRQTQQKHCFGMKAHGADRRPHQPTSRGAQRARSEPLGGPDHRQSQDGGVDPQPCSPGRGGTRTQGRGHRLSLAPPQGRAILVKRGPQSKDAPCWFRALPPCGSATWRGHPAPQSGSWAMGRRLFGSPGGDLASTPGCHVLTPSSWQHHTAEASPSQGRVGGRGGSRSARPPTRIAGTCVRNLTPLLALSLEKISLYINISRDHKRPTEPEGTLQALLMVVCSEVRPSGRLGAGRQQGWHSEALRGHGLDPSRLNKRTWNEQRLLGLRDGHGHPGSARDGSPGRRPPAQDALRGLLAL